MLTICAINFWPSFELASSFLDYLLRSAFGAYRVVPSEAAADMVFSSVFVQRKPECPQKTICLIWENIRPDFEFAQYAISSDFDDYGGRNVRCPYWYSQLAWPGLPPRRVRDEARNHGHEPLIPLDVLARARTPAQDDRRSRFCCFVAGNPEPHRIRAVEALRAIGPVDCYGNAFRAPLRQSKLDVLPRYRFNLCFENSLFPGYYTEKLLHAWAAGCVPLYFADRFAALDFNPAAMVNRADFPTLTEFVEHVRKISASEEAMREIASQPLVLKQPTLEPTIGFLRRVREEVTAQGSAVRHHTGSATWTLQEEGRNACIPSVSRNALCPCGSGQRYKHCHGATPRP